MPTCTAVDSHSRRSREPAWRKSGKGMPQRGGRTNYDGSPGLEEENGIVRKYMVQLGISCEAVAGARRPMESTTGESGFGEKWLGSPRRTQIRTSEWRISAERILQRVNQDENLGDAVFSDGHFALRHVRRSRWRMAPQFRTRTYNPSVKQPNAQKDRSQALCRRPLA